MTIFGFTHVLVWDQMGGVVRVARRATVTITDPSTGAAAPDAPASVTSDESGHVTFQSSLATVRLTAPSGYWQDVTSADAVAAAASSAGQIGMTLVETADAGLYTVAPSGPAAFATYLSKSEASATYETAASATSAHNTLTTNLTGAQGQIDSLTAVAATVDDLTATVIVPAWRVTGASQPFVNVSTSMTLWVAPFPCRVTAAWVSWEYFNLATSDVDYWATSIARRTAAGTLTNMASRSTKVAGGTAITARTPWSYAAATWDTSAAELAAGDMLVLQLDKTGAPIDMSLPLTCTWRWAPL